MTKREREREKGRSRENDRRDEKAMGNEREPGIERYLLIGSQEFSI